jgi:hypothetical protein
MKAAVGPTTSKSVCPIKIFAFHGLLAVEIGNVNVDAGLLFERREGVGS